MNTNKQTNKTSKRLLALLLTVLVLVLFAIPVSAESSAALESSIPQEAIISQEIAIDENGNEVLVTVFDIQIADAYKTTRATTRAITVLYEATTYLNVGAYSTLVSNANAGGGLFKKPVVTCLNIGNADSAGALSFSIGGVVKSVDAGTGVQFSLSKGTSFNVLAFANWWDDYYSVVISLDN